MPLTTAYKPVVCGGPRPERAVLREAKKSDLNPDLYICVADIWRCNRRARVRTFQWFPVGTVLVLFMYDYDRFGVNIPATIAENGFSIEWLNENKPGADDFQIPLFNYQT